MEKIEYYEIGKRDGKVLITSFPYKSIVCTFESEYFYKEFMKTIEKNIKRRLKKKGKR